MLDHIGVLGHKLPAPSPGVEFFYIRSEYADVAKAMYAILAGALAEKAPKHPSRTGRPPQSRLWEERCYPQVPLLNPRAQVCR